MEGPTGAVQKQMAPRVRYPTTLTKGGWEMAKSVEERTRGEVSCQELSDPCGHETRRHGFRLAQVSVDNDLLCWLQDHPPNAALLRSDLTVIPLANCTL